MAEVAPLDEQHPIYGPFFGTMGAASAIIFTCKLSSRNFPWNCVAISMIHRY